MKVSTGYKVVCYMLTFYCAGAALMSFLILLGERDAAWPCDGLILLFGASLLAYSLNKLFEANKAGFVTLRASFGMFAIFIVVMYWSSAESVAILDFALLLSGVFVVLLFYWGLEHYMRDQLNIVAEPTFTPNEPR